MKLNYHDLKGHLANKLAAIYIVSSDDLFLKQDVIRQIRKTADQAGYKDRSRYIIESGFDWNALYSNLFSASLLTEKRFIELDARHAAPGKIGGEVLEAYAASPSPDTILIIDSKKIDDKIAKSAWYRACDKSGITIPLWPIPREQLPKWILQRAKSYKLDMTHDAAVLLSDYIEGNLAAAAQAIEKIYLLQHKQLIDASIVETILTDESQFSIFDFVESLISGNQKRALHILEHLKIEGTEPTLILWGITRELRMLDAMAQALKQGSNYETVFKQNRIFAKRQAAIRSFLGSKTSEDCRQLLCQAAKLDRMMKGALAGNVWDNFQFFCLRLART